MVTAALFVAFAASASAIRLTVRVIVPVRSGIPLGTLVVNLTGAFLLGLIVGWSPPAGTIAATAGLGALTTFSTLSSEVVSGWEEHRTTTAAYLIVTLVAGVALAWLGLRLAG